MVKCVEFLNTFLLYRVTVGSSAFKGSRTEAWFEQHPEEHGEFLSDVMREARKKLFGLLWGAGAQWRAQRIEAYKIRVKRPTRPRL